MSTQKQWPLLLGLCLLACLPVAVRSACCTIGQPTYIGSGFSTLPEGGPLPIGTCSDGPCSGPGFDYLVTGGVQSQDALSCCEIFSAEEEANLGFYYNPQLGSKYPNGSLQLWYSQSTLFFPGTGKTCDPRRQRFQCKVGGEQIPTCQDLYPLIPGSQQFECPEGYRLNEESYSTNLTVEACCLLRCPDLALLSQFPDAYPQSRPSANLSAVSQSNTSTCVKAPSLRLGSLPGLTVTQPITAVCECVTHGPWDLNPPIPPPGTEFDRWECYNITTGTAVGPVLGNTLTMTIYDKWTCVAIFKLLPLPRLALLSEFPAEYLGPTASLKALINGTSSMCIKAPSTRYDGSIVTVLTPGPGFCGAGETGFVPPGSWSLEQTTPFGTKFDRWECWNITTGVAVSIPFPVELDYEDVVTCVAIYSLPLVPSPSPSPSPEPRPSPAPSPSPTPALPKLALISEFPPEYDGPTANLAADGPVDCVRNPSERLGFNNVTVLTPGNGQCRGTNGYMQPGSYNLIQTPPSGTKFEHWNCFNITSGAPVQVNLTGSTLSLEGVDSVTCVAVYSLLVPSPRPSPSPSPEVLLSPSPSPSPVPAQLAIISQFPANYTGPGANLGALSPNGDCVRAPSEVLDRNNISVVAPGSGQCGAGGLVPPGNFSLTQVAPPGTVFVRWECYDISSGTPSPPILVTVIPIENGDSYTCVAVYDLAPLPSPSPSPSPSPVPAKLALISQFPANYTGPTANLVAQSPNGNCVKAPSPRRSDNITVTEPGPGWCGPNNSGEVPPGQYTLIQNPPPGTVFVRWDCYDVQGPTILDNFTTPADLNLQELDEVTCVAVYDILPGTCADVTPAVSGNQQYTCSRSTLAFNQSALSMGPPSDVVCCQATCADTNITAGSAVRWSCPANMTYNMDADMATSPSDKTCCIGPGGAPFTLVKTGPLQNMTVGQAFAYFITVAFFGPARGVRITDFLPAAVNLSSTPATWRPQGGTSTPCVPITQIVPQQLICDLGATTTWNAGDIVEITVPAVAGLAAATSAINTAVITDDQNRSANDTHPVTIIADPAGVFSFTKIGPTPNKVSQNVPFLFDVTVVFLSSARGVKIVDVMPTGLAPSGTATWVATQTSNGINNGTCATVNRTATAGAGYSCDLGPTVTWARGDRIVLAVPAVATTPLLTLTNQATVTDELNRTASANATVVSDLPPLPNALMNIIKSGPTEPIGVGEPLTFTIRATFDARGPFTNAIIVDDLPTGLLPGTAPATWIGSNNMAGVLRGNCTTQASSPEFICILGASVVWDLDDYVEVTVPAIAGPNAATNLVNRAVINATHQGQVVTLSDTHAVDIIVPTLTISKLGPGVDVPAKQTFTWTVTCGVEGTKPVRPLILVDQLQSTNVRFVLPMPPNCTLINDQRAECFWNETVLPGQPKVVQFRAVSDVPGMYENFASVRTTQQGVASKNATADVVITDEGMIDPSKRNVNVTKTGPKQPVKVGSNFDFLINVSSNVPIVSLTDTMDASTGITFLAITPAAGCTLQPQLLRCNLTAPFPKTLRLTAKGSKAGTFTNNIVVQSSGGGDDDGADVVIFQQTCATWYATNQCPLGFRFDETAKDDPVTSDIGAALACCVATTGQSVPDVQITKVAQRDQVKVGDIFNYTIEVKNLGTLDLSTATAYRVTVSDELPVGVAPVSAGAATIMETGRKCDLSGPNLRRMTCNLGDLVDQERRIIQVKVKADGKNFAGTSKSRDVLNNQATVRCRTKSDAATDDNRCTKSDDVDITVTKEVTPSQESVDVVKSVTPLSGEVPTTFTFTITLDPGRVTATDVVLEDKIPRQLTDAKLLTPFSGRCKITTVTLRRRTSAKRGLLVAQQAPSAAAAADTVDGSTAATAAAKKPNPLSNVLNQIRNGGKNQAKPKPPNPAKPSGAVTQQTLRCEFPKLSQPRNIKYTAVGSVKGKWRNVAVAKPKNGNPKEDDAEVTVTDPQRPTDPVGACCDRSYSCRDGVPQSECTRAGGLFSDSPMFSCASGRFCTGACCTGGGTTAATCRTTRRDLCEISLFSANTWSSTGDCNSGSFCPKPTQCFTQCQPCDSTRPCCTGYACVPAGNGWTQSGSVCQRTSCTTCGQAAAAAAGSSATAAAAGTAEPAAAGAKVEHATCSPRGGICGRHENGLQCCGPHMDCIVGDDVTGRCQPRRKCKQQGSKCDGAGQCCSGQICNAATGVCERAKCETPHKCTPRDYMCKYWYELRCEVFYSAASSSSDR